MPQKMVRSVYHYNNDAYPNPYPGKFYPDQVIEWKFHKLLNKKDYLGDGEKLLKNTDYGYNYLYVDVANRQSEMRMLYGYNIVSWHSCPTDYGHYYFQDAGSGLRGDSRDVQATVTETNYSEGTSLVNSTKLSFGSSEWDARTGLPTQITRVNSDSTVYVTSYKYPYHYASGTPEYAVAQRMIQNNDVTRTFEEFYSIGTSADVMKKLKYNFGLTSKTISYQLNSLQISRASAADIKNVERYTRYNERGNLTEYVRQDGCTVTILWGYNYQLPIAEIVGANYATVSSKIPSYASLQTLDGTILQTTLNAIRSGLPAAMVTTYTYYPGRGLATQTASNGKITTYEYSGGGELLKQKDANGKTVESYEYKYYR